MKEPDCSFSRFERISDSETISVLRKKGERFVIPPFVIFRRPRQEGFPRLVISLSARSGKSVARNYARRRLREFFRQNKDKLGVYDYLFVSHKGVGSLEKREWSGILERLAKFLNVGDVK